MFTDTIPVTYTYSNNSYKILQVLNGLPDLIACDFETANKVPEENQKILRLRADRFNDLSAKQQVEADGLSHPALTVITHLSIGWSDRDAFVAICDTPHIRTLVCKWLVTTKRKQIWHNSTFDFKHIYYNTGCLPKHYVDTQLFAKTLLNDADSFKANTRLKDLMGKYYGDWAIQKGAFTLENMHNESMLKYAAIDGAATYKLYQDILEAI